MKSCRKGYTRVKGKCLSKNPFKMWGAWVSGIILAIYVYTLRPICPPCSADPEIACAPCALSPLIPIIFPVVGFFVGFLIGWAVHSYIRKMK